MLSTMLGSMLDPPSATSRSAAVNSAFASAMPTVPIEGYDNSNARLLTLEGAGHPASFVPDTCINDAIAT